MSKKIIASFAAAAVLLAAGCSSAEPAKSVSGGQDITTAQITAAPSDNNGGQDTEKTENGGKENDLGEKLMSGFSMKVSGVTGKLSISRAANKSTSMGEDGTWTIFVYLCGTDLESSGQGSASSDINQMMAAAGSDKVNFVIQTGGTSQWMNEQFSSDQCERYVINSGVIYQAESVPLTNMGDPSTLEDFLNWGVTNYPAERMGVVFWDHGGGSITGACFDELNNNNSLSLSEINTAFSKVYANMTDKFEFIGFDCCLMGTAETANVLATYARYFYGSQETEPGSGWDYTTYGTFLAQNPSANGAELGKVITDSFYNECAQVQQENECTFTIIDLEKYDDFVVAFNDYAKALYEAAGSNLAGIVRGVNKADNFGGNNKSEGYTNMVDIGGIISQCSEYADGSAVLSALKNCIVYNKNGSDHRNASGLSIYYPLQVEGSNELGIFSGICISPYYLSLVDMVAKGYSDNGYSNEVFFTEDGDWSCEDCETQGYDESYFEYADEEGYNDASELITFASRPGFDEEGYYGFTLDKSGLEYAADVCALIYYSALDKEFEIGETYDIAYDWEKGTFSDNFHGYWSALPDGQIIPTYIVGAESEYDIYTSPIKLNGERTNLRIRIYQDYTVVVDGAWDGIDENGIAAREVKAIKEGDVIVPMYYAGDDLVDGQPYTYSGGDLVVYNYLPEGDYEYCFCIEDVYGNYYNTDIVIFGIDGEGNITFDNSDSGYDDEDEYGDDDGYYDDEEYGDYED